jgi:hypothetical protein
VRPEAMSGRLVGDTTFGQLELVMSWLDCHARIARSRRPQNKEPPGLDLPGLSFTKSLGFL